MASDRTESIQGQTDTVCYYCRILISIFSQASFWPYTSLCVFASVIFSSVLSVRRQAKRAPFASQQSISCWHTLYHARADLPYRTFLGLHAVIMMNLLNSRIPHFHWQIHLRALCTVLGGGLMICRGDIRNVLVDSKVWGRLLLFSTFFFKIYLLLSDTGGRLITERDYKQATPLHRD